MTQQEYFSKLQRIITDLTKEAQSILTVPKQNTKNTFMTVNLLAEDSMDSLLENELLKVYNQITPCTDIDETTQIALNEQNPDNKLVIRCKLEVKAQKEDFIPNSFISVKQEQTDQQTIWGIQYQTICQFQNYDINELLNCSNFDDIAKLVKGPRRQEAPNLIVIDRSTVLNDNRSIGFLTTGLSKILHIDQLRQTPHKVSAESTGQTVQNQSSKKHILRIFVHQNTRAFVNSNNFIDFIFQAKLGVRDGPAKTLHRQGSQFRDILSQNLKPQGPSVPDLDKFIYQNRQYITYVKTAPNMDGAKFKYKDRDIFISTYQVIQGVGEEQIIQTEKGLEQILERPSSSTSVVDIFLLNGLEGNLKALQKAQKKNLLLLSADGDFVSEYVEKQKSITKIAVAENQAMNHAALSSIWKYINQKLFD